MPYDLAVRVSRFFNRHKLAGSKLVVAVSGGPDSVCLLHLLYNFKNELGLELHVAHVNHLLRGEESESDSVYVSELTKAMGLPCTIGQADVKAYHQIHKLTLEEAAREMRYRFLSEVARDVGTEFIVTGHTQNDNVETILLHIIRGSGTRGLVGLRHLTPRTIESWRFIIARPMLDITREETVEYCRQQGLEPRLDSSNLEMSPLRNKIRLELLPLLSRYNANIPKALLRLSSSATDELDYLDERVGELWDQVVQKESEVITLDKKGLSKIHPALKRQLLRACLDHLPGGLKDIESRHIEDMLSLMDKPPGGRIDLPHGFVFMTGYDCYWLGKADALPGPFPPLDGQYPLTIPGTTGLPGWKVTTKILDTFDKGDDSAVACLDFDAAGPNLSVRTWKKGDHFQPLGMDHEKKLGEFMIDARIPRLWRHNIPLVVSTAGVIWLVGYRLNERVKVTPETSRVLKLEFERVQSYSAIHTEPLWH